MNARVCTRAEGDAPLAVRGGDIAAACKRRFYSATFWRYYAGPCGSNLRFIPHQPQHGPPNSRGRRAAPAPRGAGGA
jgi:hypothetical protein